MLKAQAGNLILLGLDAENVKRLKADNPILIKGDAIGIDKDIIIAYGDTIDVIAEKFDVPMIIMPKTLN